MLVVAAVVAGIVLWVRADSRPGVEVLLPTPSSLPELKVYISGAVAHPGVYELSDGERLGDAIAAAGGPTADANLSAVNLALRLRDEDHFHVPLLGEEDGQLSAAAPSSAGGKIDINTAPAEVLETLPGIGETKAGDIVAYRNKNGRFEATEDIMRVKGIGSVTFDAIRGLISVR